MCRIIRHLGSGIAFRFRTRIEYGRGLAIEKSDQSQTADISVKRSLLIACNGPAQAALRFRGEVASPDAGVEGSQALTLITGRTIDKSWEVPDFELVIAHEKELQNGTLSFFGAF